MRGSIAAARWAAGDEQSGARASWRAMRRSRRPRISRGSPGSRSGCRPHRPGTRFRGGSRPREVGSHLVLDASQRTSRGHRAGQADGQPRHPVPQASAHCFLAGGSGVRSGGQKAAVPVKILVVLPEQDAGEPLGRMRATTGGSVSITSASTASAGAVRSSSIGARPARRPFVDTARRCRCRRWIRASRPTPPRHTPRA